MKYYTIQNNSLITADTETALKRFYKEVSSLPDDYEQGKYIVQNGELVINENFEAEQAQKERERISMLSLTKREVFLALYKDKGITPDVLRGSITDPEALIEFDYAEKYFRGNVLIDKIGVMLGYSMEDLDHLFETGELPEKVEETEQDNTNEEEEQ